MSGGGRDEDDDFGKTMSGERDQDRDMDRPGDGWDQLEEGEEGEEGAAKESKEKVIVEVIGAILILVGIVAAIILIMNKTQNFCSKKGGADVTSPMCKSLGALSGALATLLSLPGLIIMGVLAVAKIAVSRLKKNDGVDGEHGGGGGGGGGDGGGGDDPHDDPHDGPHDGPVEDPDPDENIFKAHK